MYASFLLALSVLLQLIAAALALRLIRITGWRGTWLFIAAAILLQAVRRCVMLVAIWTGYILGPPDLVSEWVGLVVSALMVAGVGWIAPLFLSVRRLHEEALRSAELEKATVFDTMSDLVVYHDMDMRIVRANKAAAESVGSTPDGLRGRFCYEIRHGRSEVCEGCPVVKARQTGQPQEAQMRGPGGRTWFVRADPLRDATGKLVGILEVTQNITERSRMEAERARLATAIEQAAEAIVITDTEGAIQYVNPAFERITGYTLEEAIGQNPRVLKSGKQDEGFYKQLWDTILQGEVWSGHFVNKRKDGTLYEEEATISPVRDGTGAITNFVAVKRDVTHEVVLEAQLRHAQRMEAVGTLASGVAHDFNNLLTAIFGYTDLAKETLPDGHAAIRSLEMVEHAARQASGVTRSLLTFSRKVTADKAPIQLGTVVTESVRLFRRLLPASIDIANDVPTETDIWVNADAIQVQQVLMNLAANARDAMPDGGRLRISLRQDRANPVNLHTAGGSDGHPTAVLVVEDTGTGMSEETTSRLFEPFYTTKPREQGTGLGMSAVHGIITDHGGRIDVDSQLGKGTRITISLPCCDPSEQLSPEPARARRKPGDGEVILLVEDDPQIRSIMTSTLRAQNHCIIQACGSLEAMAALDTHRNAVRLIVLDADLPKNRGRFCLREMSQMRPDLPVLVVTGSEDIDAQEDLNGKHCVLRKPFAMSGLASLVVNILAKSTVKASRGLQPAREAAP